MAKNEDNHIGYFKFTGKSVEDGYLDAKQSANILNGIDEVIGHFLGQIDPELKNVEFSIPVKVQKGSWEALIPETLEQWLKTAAGLGITTYLTTAAKKLAENDFDKIGFKEILKQSFKAVKWVIAIAKHLKTLNRKDLGKTTFKEKDGIVFVGIYNEEGKILYVPENFLKFYFECPEKLFNNLTKPISQNRELEISLSNSKDKDDLQQPVKIRLSEKLIFTKEVNNDEVIFPELKQGDLVELEGRVTRGNENSNTIGFEYKNHILICSPVIGHIKNQKELLFTNCKITGYIDRTDRDGFVNEKKPKIRYTDLVEVEDMGSQYHLFK